MTQEGRVAPVAGRLRKLVKFEAPLMSIKVSGTEGYAEKAESLVKQWQNISFADQHKPVLHLIPEVPSRILDVGSGVGVDAAAFAAMGHAVVAVEPVDELRVAGIEQHPSSKIEWIDDSLPDLAILLSRSETFDVVMLTAVWMHLDEQQRSRAMPSVSSLVSEGGVLIMSLRHGPVPRGGIAAQLIGDDLARHGARAQHTFEETFGRGFIAPLW
jgi:SAM-dependent methyltransferase